MIPRRHRPEPALAQHVECLWYLDAPAAHYPRERALPDGSLELVFNLGSDPMRIFAGDLGFLSQARSRFAPRMGGFTSSPDG